MIDRLDSILKRYEELHHLLSDNEIIADKGKYSQLAKEFSSMQDIVVRCSEYKKITADIEETNKLLDKETHPEFIELARKEIEDLEDRKNKLKGQLEECLIGEDLSADKDAIMEIRAGTGGLEASLFAGDLFRMYSKYISQKGWRLEVIDSHPAEKGGFKEIIFNVKGKDVYKNLKYEKGVHRVQRVPITEASGRIHTSAVSVVVLPEAEDIELDINSKDLKIDTFRSSGAGGQHVNVTDSAVRITHLPTGIIVQCQNERSQYKNKESAMKVLKARILDKLKSDRDKKTATERKMQVGTGDRSEKIRTYNFPDRRVTDHRIGFTIHKLDRVMEGEIDEIIEALMSSERKLKLG